MAKHHDFLPLTLPKELLSGWQSAVDIMATVMGIPIGLVTRLQGNDLEVLLTSRNEENPFTAGEEIGRLGSGSYCEEVVRLRGLLRVTNAGKSRAWESAPPVQDVIEVDRRPLRRLLPPVRARGGEGSARH